MTNQQHPAQFDWATELSDAQGRVTLSEQEAHEIGARLRRLHCLHSENETLQAGYAAARLEIESLQAGIKTMAEEHADELMVAHLDGRMRAAQPAGAQQPAPSAAATQDMIAAVLQLVDLEQGDVEDHRYDDGSKLAEQICKAVLALVPQPSPTPQADSQPAPAAAAWPVEWRELAARVMDALADAQEQTNSAYPAHASRYPAWEAHARWLRWHADMFRTGKPVGSGAGQPAVLAALAAAPTTQPTPQPLPASQGDALLAATSTTLEVLQKHRQMKGDWPMGELGRRAAEELQAARHAIFSTARAAQEGKSHD